MLTNPQGSADTQSSYMWLARSQRIAVMADKVGHRCNLAGSRDIITSTEDIQPEKCASSEGWHEQWVKVPPG